MKHSFSTHISSLFPGTSSARGGFTLVEMLVAVAILSVAVGGFMTMAVSSLQSFDSGELKNVAAKAGQEAMEAVISKRDNNLECLKDSCGDISQWDEELVERGTRDTWLVDVSESDQLEAGGELEEVNPNNLGPDAELCRLDSGVFTHCSDPDKKVPGDMTRIVTIERATGNTGRYVVVKVIVEWNDQRFSDRQELMLETALFNYNN